MKLFRPLERWVQMSLNHHYDYDLGNEYGSFIIAMHLQPRMFFDEIYQALRQEDCSLKKRYNYDSSYNDVFAFSTQAYRGKRVSQKWINEDYIAIIEVEREEVIIKIT